MKLVMCFGTFDLLHLGHLHYFQEAKKHGDYLIVVIARDITKKKQHKKVLFSEQERQKLVQSSKLVDEAVLGYPDDDGDGLVSGDLRNRPPNDRYRPSAPSIVRHHEIGR